MAQWFQNVFVEEIIVFFANGKINLYKIAQAFCNHCTTHDFRFDLYHGL